MITDPLRGKVLTPFRDAAAYLGGVSPTTIRRLADAGRLKIVYVGDRPMITVESIRRFVASGGSS